MNYSIMTERETEIELSTSVSEGLTSFTAHDRLIDNGRNLPEKTYAKSVVSVALSQFTNLYTVAFIVMGIITLLCDFKGSTWAWVIFFAVAVINMVSGFLRDNQNRKIAMDFDLRRSEDVKIIRDGKEVMSDPTLIVKGDIVVLNEGDFVPCDIRILKCEALKADESIFKGRFVPVDKKSERVWDDVDYADSPNMLYCGSVIAQGWALGAVTATGKDTTLAKTIESKSRKMDMHDKFAKSAASEKMLVLAALIAAMIVVCFVAVTEKSTAAALLKACTVALCLLPAPVCLVRMLGAKYFEKKMEKADVALGNNSVYNTGMTEYLLFDKGGILTNGDMVLEDRVFAGRDKMEMAVICTDCKFTEGILSGSDIDKATVESFMEEGIDAKKIIEENEKILFMPFDEQRKLMAVLIKHGAGYRLIVKGSVEVVPTLCSHLADEGEIFEMSGEIMHRMENISSAMAERGLKIRAVAYRDIDFVPENLEDEIKALTFAGALGYREVMAKKVRESVKKIENPVVRSIMVTGDLTITAAVLARQAGLIKRESECISFRELADCTDDELIAAANRYKVFTCATREDRERLVKVLGNAGSVTMVAGEQMTEPSVRVGASISIGDKDNPDCDILVEKSDIASVADVLCDAKAIRGNMAYATLLAISVGFAEALMLMYLMFAREAVPTSFDMLLANLFIMFVPCTIVALFARVQIDTKNQRLMAAKCILRGVIAALMGMLAGGNVITYFVLFAILSAGSMVIEFNNLEKGKSGLWGVIATAIVLVITMIAASVGFGALTGEYMASSLVCALLAVVINAVIGNLKLKGRSSSDV